MVLQSENMLQGCLLCLAKLISLVPSCAFSSFQVSNDSVNRTFTALIICEKGNEEGEGKGNNSDAFPHLFNTALFIPEGLWTDEWAHVDWCAATHACVMFALCVFHQALAATRCRSWSLRTSRPSQWKLSKWFQIESSTTTIRGNNLDSGVCWCVWLMCLLSSCGV